MDGFLIDTSGLDVNVSCEDNSGVREPLPIGVYTVELKAENGLTKAGDQAMKIEATVIEGKHAKRKMWTTYLYKNLGRESKHFQAQRVRELVRASGYTKAGVEQINGSTVRVEVGIKQGDATKNSMFRFGKCEVAAVAQYVTEIQDTQAVQAEHHPQQLQKHMQPPMQPEHRAPDGF